MHAFPMRKALQHHFHHSCPKSTLLLQLERVFYGTKKLPFLLNTNPCHVCHQSLPPFDKYNTKRSPNFNMLESGNVNTSRVSDAKATDAASQTTNGNIAIEEMEQPLSQITEEG